MIYANISAASKYASQKPTTPFPVMLADGVDEYCWHGNENRYRTEDLEFFVKEGDQFQPHGILRPNEAIALRGVESVITWAEQNVNSRDIYTRDAVYRIRESDLYKAFQKLSDLLPKETPTCRTCGKTARACDCN